MTGAPLASYKLPKHPALGMPAFRWMRTWRQGPGRWAGRVSVVVGVLLVVWFFAAQNVLLANCTNPDDHNQCMGDAAATGNVVWALGLTTFGFLVATAAANLRQLARLRSRRRALEARRAGLPAALSPAQTSAFLAASQVLADPAADHETASSARDNFFAWSALLLPATLVETLQTFRYHAGTGGTIEASYDIALLRFHFIVLIIVGLFASRSLRAAFRLRGAARTLLDEAFDGLEKEEQALRQAERGEPHAFRIASFRPWAPKPLPKG